MFDGACSYLLTLLSYTLVVFVPSSVLFILFVFIQFIAQIHCCCNFYLILKRDKRTEILRVCHIYLLSTIFKNHTCEESTNFNTGTSVNNKVAIRVRQGKTGGEGSTSNSAAQSTGFWVLCNFRIAFYGDNRLDFFGFRISV